METDEQLKKLLALKRYEHPPEGYHTSFLYEFRRRQRASLMRKSSLALFFEHLGDLWPNFQVPRLAYASIAAVAVVLGAAFLVSPQKAPTSDRIAGTELHSMPDFSLSAQRPVTIPEALPASTRSAASQHYVLQPRPASNDLPLSF